MADAPPDRPRLFDQLTIAIRLDRPSMQVDPMCCAADMKTRDGWRQCNRRARYVRATEYWGSVQVMTVGYHDFRMAMFFPVCYFHRDRADIPADQPDFQLAAAPNFSGPEVGAGCANGRDLGWVYLP